MTRSRTSDAGAPLRATRPDVARRMRAVVRFLAWACLGLGPTASAIAADDAWPAHAIHWVVPFPPGGTTDVVARAVAQRMGERLGVAIVVDNKGGAGGTIGIAFVAKAAADGYTLLVSDASVATAPSLYRGLSFDVARDLTPVVLFATVPHVLVVDPKRPIHDVASLIATAKSAPGRLDFASGGIGSPLHLAGEAFRIAAGIDWTHVPYRGAGPAILAVMAGEAQVATPSLPAALPQIAGGRLRALAVTSARRVASLPDVPSMTEVGLPGAVVNGWVGLHAPAGTPPAVLARLRRAAAEALAAPDVRHLLEEQGATLATQDAADYGRMVATETDRWRRVVEAGRIVPP